MTLLMDNSFGDLEKFPTCMESNCAQHLELQNRFKCNKCLQVFCCTHRLDFTHNCSSLKKTKNETLEQVSYVVLPKCAEVGCRCKLTSINKFTCNKCYKTYCMTHRLDFVHKCSL